MMQCTCNLSGKNPFISLSTAANVCACTHFLCRTGRCILSCSLNLLNMAGGGGGGGGQLVILRVVSMVAV